MKKDRENQRRSASNIVVRFSLGEHLTWPDRPDDASGEAIQGIENNICTVGEQHRDARRRCPECKGLTTHCEVFSDQGEAP